MRNLDIKKQVKEAELPDEEFEIIDTDIGNKYQNHIKVEDIRKIDATSGLPVTDTNNLTALADPEIIKKIVASAKKRNIDPYTALAMANQETGFGMEKPENPFVINAKSYPDKQSGDMIENAMDVLKEKLDYAKKLGKKDEAEIIQAWNGYGKIGKNFYKDHPDVPRIKSFYGVDVTNQDIDMNKNPVYGKRILDIRENIIKKHPEIVKLVEGEKQDHNTVNPKWKGYRSVKGTKSGKNYVWTGKDQFDPQGYYYEL